MWLDIASRAIFNWLSNESNPRLHWVNSSYGLWLVLKTCATLWAKHMQRDKTYSDLISDTFLYFGYFTCFFFQLSLHSQVHFNNSPCPDWPLWWIIGLNTQIKTPRSDYHVTSLYSIHTLYSKQVMRTLKLIRYNLQYYLDWNLILIINLQGNV